MEVPIMGRLISSKNRSGGLLIAQIKEVLIIERCPHIEVLL
jgi:hypothetical protein